ncbi:transcription termination factor MTERF2, chloroplastic-like isoform X1 [Chenopodium quinoa]|uniref:transcription termination factor MTERF2, chloroplastic-like isoform X1 n=1 Tax=Chenopodium quinoa TaxID=63459 RepID=UPI000B78F1A7|nr:transcription termination factor MTERF2, chloroplastic-like isoform X1 [Chenopodium quinoa]
MLLPSISSMSFSPLFPPSSSSPTFHRNYSLFYHHHLLPHHQCLKPLSHNNTNLTLKAKSHSLGPASSSLESEVVEGIAEIVAEAGVEPQIVSEEIASKAPQYAKMLRDSVAELDELALWNSWMKVEMAAAPLTLKEKIKYIAKEKGDNGKIPYLESLGLSLASAIHLARLLSSQSLSSLIQKVLYVKEICFSGSDDKRQIGKRARRMMLYLSISIDEDLQQTLSFFEKIEARRGGLNMLGSFDTSFRYLIESFPRILLLSVESNMKPMMNFMENAGVPRECMGDVLLLFPPLFFRDIEAEIGAGSWTFEMVGALDKKLGRMLVKYPWVLSKSIQKNYNDILAFFETEMVPKVCIERAIRDWPLLLGCSASKLKPMIEEFDDQGVRTTKLGKAIATSPQLLLRRPEEFRKVVIFLQDVGFDKESIGTILARCPEIFATRTVENYQKKLEFLTSLGISEKDLPRVIKKYPEFLISDVDSTVKPRLRYLMNAGLTERHIATMIVRFSPLLGYSIEEVLRPKLQFLVYTMGKSVKEVVDYPRYFSYSMEKKIKPRFLLLRSRNINISLKVMLAKNDDEFTTEFLAIERTFVSDK